VDEEGFFKFARHMAGSNFIASRDPLFEKLPLEQEPPLLSLPVDDEPWFGGLLSLVCPSSLTKAPQACTFVFWATRHATIGVEEAGDFEATDPVCSLSDAMHSPRSGAPRRPQTIITTDVFALLLRARGEKEFGVAPDSFLKIEEGSVHEARARVRRWLLGVGSGLS